MRILRPIVWATVMVAAFIYITSVTHWDFAGVHSAGHYWSEPASAATGYAPDEQNNIDIYKSCRDATVNITSRVYREDIFWRVYPEEGTGSGFIINQDGEILTNNHVVQGATTLTVKLADRKEYKAKVLGRDPGSDLALIKIEAGKKLPALRLGESDNVVVGQKVLAIGNPFGYEGTLTTGIVSSLDRSIRTEDSQVPLEGMIQTDAAINPGNSGGPLLDSHGNVIGINTAIVGQGNVGIGFAMPISRAKAMLDEFQKSGHISRPTLGIRTVFIAGDLAEELHLPATGGLLIQSVEDGSPARDAGLRGPQSAVIAGNYRLGVGGDFITAVEGQKVDGNETLQRVMNKKRGGDMLELTVVRNGKSETVKVHLGEAPTVIKRPMPTDTLLKWRAEFPILAHTTYMISHSLGAMPARTYGRVQQFAETWATRGIRAWEEGWWDMPITVGNLVGRIIGAGEGEVVMQQNVSICQSVVTSCFNWSGPRNKLITDGLNFPSNDYIYHGLARQGARVVSVPSPDGFSLPVELLLEAIDEETQLVSVSHVAFRSSNIQDLAAIVERAHRVGALVIADLYQSAGTVPVDVRALNVDFATGGSVKWLCGGPGAGYLYVRRDLWPTLEPVAIGWMAHEEPFAFAGGPIRYADSAYRFLNGTPNVPALYSARSGYEIINEIGVPAIREKSMRQTARLMELGDAAGLKMNTCRDATKRGGVVTFDVENGKEVTRELARREILVDYRPGAGVRVAAHFYTTDDELDHTVSQIRELALAVGRA